MITSRPFLCSCLALLACVPAAAQTVTPPRPERPYRGMFASGVDNSGQTLTAGTSLSGGYDDNILADATNRQTPLQDSQQGTLGQFSGTVNYNFTRSRATVNAGAGTSIRYYPALEQEYFKTYNAGIGAALQVLSKPSLTLHQSANYQPYSFLSRPIDGLDPGLDPLIAPEPDFVPIASQYVSYESGADFDAQLSRRTNYLLSYDYRLADRTGRRFWRQMGSTGFKWGLTRDLSLRTIYRYTEAHFSGRVVKMHSPDIGLDFNRALSLTRRTSLTFGAGTEAIMLNDETRYRATGRVNVAHEIARTWSATASYQRGTYFVDTLSAPVYGDSVLAGIGGLLTRRIQLQATANAMIGNTGFDVRRRFDSYRGAVSLSTALNRFMNVGVDYAYYKYIFDPQVELEPGVPRDVNRQSVRAHVSFWAPLLNKTRRRDASR
jgi:hypothetical protein